MTNVMASCPNCKADVSSSAFTCQVCGFQLQTPKPIHFYEQEYLQRGPYAPRFVAMYALVLSLIVFFGFPTPWKVYGFAVALGVETYSIARGCYGTGTFTLIISVLLLLAFEFGL